MLRPRFWEGRRLSDLDREEWEALCDGCGKCCLHKLEDEESGRIYRTNVACRLLDRETARCSDYRNRRAHVPDCVQLRPDLVPQIDWLPSTCAYRLVEEGKPLPAWHHLVSGSRDTVHEAGASIRGWTVSEVDAGDLEYHILDGD
ncbi:YcgN family cysteine cluster protein [Sandaracinobacteroides sp. A072]|uniref:YcgN family cysteine cluster protein n=1 Tax=Sandaracinobacteroides sp. A072 TaxID=3461146 RepID=UPI0040429110